MIIVSQDGCIQFPYGNASPISLLKEKNGEVITWKVLGARNSIGESFCLGRYNSETSAKKAMADILTAYESETNPQPIDYFGNDCIKRRVYVPAKRNVVFYMPKNGGSE